MRHCNTTYSKLVLRLSYLLLVPVWGASLFAARTDTFEGGAPRWTLVQSDCQAQLTEHGLSVIRPHGGRTCELFELDCAQGTMALLAYPIEPCAVLDEFQPRLWTLCSSGRIQLGVRVIFPFESHPVTAGRLNTILWGSSYSETGQWQALQVSDLERQLREETFSLRQRFGSDLDLKGAYVDCIVLNAYTGQGRYRVQVDDLDLRGMIPLAAIGTPLPANWRQNWRWRYESPPGQKELRFWAMPNHPPVWLQHQGESLAWIESIGFTGVLAKSLVSREFLAESKQANLDVISPPPSHAVAFPPELLPSLKGWLVGAALDSQQASLARERAGAVAALPVDLQKPLIAEALEDYFVFSRVADEVIVPAPLSASSGSPREKLAWLDSHLDTVKQRGQGWVSINVGLTPTLEEQIRLADATLNPGMGETSVAEPLGLRQEVTRAVLAGAKGFVFRTSKPLDAQDPNDAAHIAAMQWINQDLRLWGPWIVAGQAVQPPAVSDPQWSSAAWNISQSHLVVTQTQAAGSQYCLPPTHGKELSFQHMVPTAGQQVFRMSLGSLERVKTRPTAAGIEWSVDHPEPIESFLITSNPTVMKFARDQLTNSAMQNAADQLEVASYNLTAAAKVVQARFRPTPQIRGPEDLPPQMLQLDAAQVQLEQGWAALRRQQPLPAMRRASSTSNLAQSILFEAHQTIAAELAAPQSSPLAVASAALGLHWQLADACEREEWVAVELPGSQFSSLESLMNAGWDQQRRLEDRVALRVELLPGAERSASGELTSGGTASGGLRMAAYPKPEMAGRLEGGYAGASLLVLSSALPVRQGQLVRISARARVIRSSGAPGCGLLVYENQVGPSLGQLVNGNPGELIPIELYRFIVQDGDFRILAECRGEVDIVLESVQASVITPATNRRSFTTAPVGAPPSESVLYPVKP